MNLHELLASKREEVMHRWKTSVQGTIAPTAMGAVELLDHLPTFLDEIASALREDAGLPPQGPSPDDSTTAAGHGAQRLRLGFSLDAVVREYGALRNAVVATARAEGVTVTSREAHVLSDAIISGIADAVTQYTQQRDAELLRQANEHFAFVAHELRNPLSTATLALALLKTRGVLPPGERSVLSLERGLKQVNELVEQTLKLARVASGIEVRREATTLRSLLKEAETAAEPEADAKGIVLTVTMQEGADEPVHVDRRLVSSALGNLLRNAVKYSHAPGTVQVRGVHSDGWLAIEIEDSCGGLPPGKVEEAFAPFVRLDDRQSGFGLGLAIAKQAVEAHGGRIRVQNVPDKCCIFVVELPGMAVHGV